ncbi:hypothetical protein F4561_005078 [Lipingzhangella halophila]|uniref:Uncharacterized protein n=1 Tax=Lipingzhangella halophila TaxID=1783352 RepID=A0A7W7W529_9ACTN|nr:hypothetical protein [Lipingzhangella halophila]
MKLYSVSRDLRPEFDIPPTRLAHDLWAALVRPDGKFLDDVLRRFLALSHDDGGYGLVRMDEADRVLLRLIVARHGLRALAAAGDHEHTRK